MPANTFNSGKSNKALAYNGNMDFKAGHGDTIAGEITRPIFAAVSTASFCLCRQGSRLAAILSLVAVLSGMAAPCACAQDEASQAEPAGSDIYPAGSGATSAGAAGSSSTSSDGSAMPPGGDPMQALKLPDTNALVGTPVNFTGWLRRGSTLYAMGKYEGALEAVRNAVAIEKDNIVAHILLADVLAKLHRYGEAEGEYEYVMSRQPSDTSIVLKLGDLYMDEGNFVNAESMYSKVVALEPGNAQALLKQARAFEGCNNLSNASEIYEQLVRAFPQTKYATSAAGRLKQLRKAQEEQRTDRYFPIDGELGMAGLGWWDLRKMPLHVYVDDGTDARGFRGEMVRSVYKALKDWSAASGNAIVFVLDPGDPAREAKWKKAESQAHMPAQLKQNIHAAMPADAVTSQIHVHWSSQLDRIIGLAWTNKLEDGSQTLRKAHVWLATNKLVSGEKIPQEVSPETASIFEAQSSMLDEIALHELGHALGLVHLTNPNDIMAPGIIGLRSGEPAGSRGLTERDVKALQEHYNNFTGFGGASPAVSQLSQEVPPVPLAAAGVTAAPVADEEAQAPVGDNQNTQGLTGTGGAAATSDTGAAGMAANLKSLSTLSPGGARSSGYDPLKEAMFLMTSRQYDKCLATLNRILSGAAGNLQARYLRACLYVHMRRYQQAASDYRQVLKLAGQSALGKRAQEGLRQICP